MSVYNPSTRQELIDFCLRKLGYPVIEINVDDDQLQDRFEDALQYYREFHQDGSEKAYLKAQITPSILNLQSGNGNSLIVGDVITGNTSGASCIVYSLTSDNVVSVKNVTGTFVANENITSNKSNIVGQLSSNDFVSLGSYDNQYFDIDEKVLSVTRMLPFNTGLTGNGVFDLQYQFYLNSMPTLTSFDLGYYAQTMSYLQTMNDLLIGQKPIRYRRHTNKLYVDWNWSTATIGNYVVVEAFVSLDPNIYTKIYSDMWFKRYLTALIKLQWGQNLIKFKGVQLPGGVILDGETTYNQALEEIEKLQIECQSTFQEPIDFFVG